MFFEKYQRPFIGNKPMRLALMHIDSPETIAQDYLSAFHIAAAAGKVDSVRNLLSERREHSSSERLYEGMHKQFVFIKVLANMHTYASTYKI